MGFPAFVPSSRNYNLGDYAVRTFRAQSGAESRILYGDSRTNAEFQLSYTNITDNNAQTFLGHYESVRGTFGTFALPANTLAGGLGSSSLFGLPFKNQRDTAATYVGPDGLIRYADPYETRFTYDDKGNATGVLVEEESINYVYPSNVVNVSPTLVINRWFDFPDMEVVENYDTAPNGKQEATLIAATGNISFRQVRYYASEDINATTVTTSVYCKAVNPDLDPLVRIWVDPDHTNGLAAGTPFAIVNYKLEGPGTVVSTFASDSVINDAYAESVGSGWYRCVLTATFSSVPRFAVLLYPGDAGAQTINSKTLFWGVQLEKGDKATSLIPSVDAETRRAADNIVSTGAWRYAEPPQIQSVRPGISTVDVRLISVV